MSRTPLQDLSSGDEQRAERIHRVLLGRAVAVSADPHTIIVAGEPRGLALAAARLEHDLGLGSPASGDRVVVEVAALLAALRTSSLGNGVVAVGVGGERAGVRRRHAKNISPLQSGCQGVVVVVLLALGWDTHRRAADVEVRWADDVQPAVAGLEHLAVR